MTDTRLQICNTFWISYTNLQLSNLSVSNIHLRDNCIQNFHSGRCIVIYTVGNLVLWRCTSGAVKCDIRPSIRYTSSKENFEYSYPHSNAFLQFPLIMESCKPHKATRHPTKCDILNEINVFQTVNRRIYCSKFLMLSHQRSHNKIKCIRILLKYLPL